MTIRPGVYYSFVALACLFPPPIAWTEGEATCWEEPPQQFQQVTTMQGVAQFKIPVATPQRPRDHNEGH